jgi:hypothetical protein
MNKRAGDAAPPAPEHRGVDMEAGCPRPTTPLVISLIEREKRLTPGARAWQPVGNRCRLPQGGRQMLFRGPGLRLVLKETAISPCFAFAGACEAEMAIVDHGHSMALLRPQRMSGQRISLLR